MFGENMPEEEIKPKPKKSKPKAKKTKPTLKKVREPEIRDPLREAREAQRAHVQMLRGK